MRSLFAIATMLIGALVMRPPQSTSLTVTGHVVRPDELPPFEDASHRLTLPDGFTITRFADGLGQPRMLAVGGDGRVYVTRRETGDVLMLVDEDGDGRADTQRVVARHPGVHGVAIGKDRIYLATVTEVYAADLRADGSLGELHRLLDDLPDGGQHPNRTIGIGPDEMLYISVGSTCNACAETNPEHATLLRASADGRSRVVFASGLRNTIGFAWHPATGELWGMDHGIDWLGDNAQVEELNRLQQGRQYGWPYVYGEGHANPQDTPPRGMTADTWARMSEPPVMGYTPHAAPMQMAFYTGTQFPDEYVGDAFVAMHGSWNRKPPSGYEVVRIDFEDGQPRRIEPFVTGFLVENGTEQWGVSARPTGLAVAGDGALLVGDDQNGVIYRIARTSARER